MEAVQADESTEVAPLLNTVVHSSFSNLCPVGPPEWLLGEWISIKGWNAGQTFKCTNGHYVASVGSYGTAIGSFSSSLREGIVDSVRILDEDTLLFTWYQETGGGMSGSAGDSGWGIWKFESTHHRLRGIWWYGAARYSTYRRDPSLLAYSWELERVSAQTTILGSRGRRNTAGG
jgi:hypothetical protein